MIEEQRDEERVHRQLRELNGDIVPKDYRSNHSPQSLYKGGNSGEKQPIMKYEITLNNQKDLLRDNRQQSQLDTQSVAHN